MPDQPQPENPEAINPVALQELADRAAEGPVVMLNLLDLKPDGGFERYADTAPRSSRCSSAPAPGSCSPARAPRR